MKKTAVANLGLHTLEIEVTTKCNFSCKHCYNRCGFIGDLPLEKATSVIDFAVENKVKNVVATGGEPLLYPQFEEFALHILNRKRDVGGVASRFVLQSNGLLLNSKNVDILRAFDLFHISMDFSDLLRTKVDHVQDTLYFLNINKLESYLFFTIHRKNFNLIDDAVAFARQRRVGIAFNTLLADAPLKRLSLSKRQLLYVSKKLLALYRDRKIMRPSCPLISILDESKSASYYFGNQGGCTAGVAACSVLPNGDVIPCPFLRVKSGNIYCGSLKDIWLGSEVFALLRDRSKYDEPCGSCAKLSFCGGCRARAYKSTGSLLGFDPMCFRELLEESRLK